MTSAADLIARRLYEAGCRYAFGIPGGEVLAILDALARVGIRVILTKHENCAGFMAEGVHHHDGAPAILVATIGPGVANAANVIANATQDRVPLIVLTGCVSAVHQHTYTHQVFDHVAMATALTKAAFRVEASSAAVLIDKAVSIATEGRPGAVLLDVPVDVQIAAVSETTFPQRAPLAAMQPSPAALIEARQWLGDAQRPLVMAGVDVLTQHGSHAVADFCHKFQVPLITTYKGKGIIAEDDPLALGGAGLSPKADAHLLALVRQSDLIILAGYDPIEMRPGWQNPWAIDTRVIEFSAVSNTHSMHQAALNFVGDVGCGLQALAESIQATPSWPDGEPTATRSALQEAFPADEDWGPAAIVDECRKRAPRDAVATADSGAHRILLSQMWRCYAPRGLLQSSALCTMGCAVALAVGRKIAEPGRPVIAFVGDAGLEMFLGELATIRDLKLSIPIVVFVDQSLALIESKQRGTGYANLAVDFGATDFPAVAKALGGEGLWCHDRATLAAQLELAFTRDTFTLISAVIGKNAYDGRI